MSHPIKISQFLILSQRSVTKFALGARQKSETRVTDYDLFWQMVELKDSLRFDHDTY